VNSIGASLRLHADFGSGLWDGGPIGIPITVVDSTTPLSSVDFEHADESDSGAPDPGWNDDDLHTLGRIKGSDFRVVDTSTLRP